MIPLTRADSDRARRSRGALRAALAAGALCLAACSSSDVLSVTDPDIINPKDVQSPAGADAVRQGALARFNAATSGGEMFLLSGMFADEWINGDSYIDRQQVDTRTPIPENSFLLSVNRSLHRARLSARQAIDLLRQYSPASPGWQTGEMYFVEAYLENLYAEDYCNGLVFSTVTDGREEYGSPMTTAAAFQLALAHADSGLALVTGSTATDVKVRSALQVTRGRILLNLNRLPEAATAVSAVLTTFHYDMYHSQQTSNNNTWALNNDAHRYSVSASEGTNGLPFATAGDPRVPVCQGGDATCKAAGVSATARDDLGKPFYVQLIWPARESSVAIADGIEARLIEAEAQLKAGSPATALATLNALRATKSGLAPLTDAGSDAARFDQIFSERGFWMFGRGHRMGDLRRLVRQYGRAQSAVFPTGVWHKGGNYGTDVTFPVPQAEQNNPNLPHGQTCIDRNA